MQPNQRQRRVARGALLAALASLSGLLGPACAHGPAAPPPESVAAPPPPPPPPDPRPLARARSAALRALLKAEAEAAWTRWTLGRGPLPSEAQDPSALLSPAALGELRAAIEAASGEERRAFSLVLATLLPRAISAAAGEPSLAFERARVGLVFALPGEGKPEHGERDLDRLLTDEPSDQRRHTIAEAEAQAASALAPLALARDAAVEQAAAKLEAGTFDERLLLLHGLPADALGKLAEATLAATDKLADQAVASSAQRNLGLTPDRVQRADLARLVRTGAADAELAAGKGWENTRQTLAALGADLAALSTASPQEPARLRIDAALVQGKAARPLALLVDPPADVRLSLRPAGGLEEQRAMLHEAARAASGAFTQQTRWELAALGDGTAASGVAFLLESLAGDPRWLRAFTGLRGEALDDVVHAEAAHRLLSVRRAAALVLFELGRRGLEAPATAALYRSLLQRATRSAFSEADAGRWPLEADGWLRPAATLRAALFGASLGRLLEQEATASAPAVAGAPKSDPAPAPWWRSAGSASRLRAIWAGGRSLRAEEAAVALAQAPAAAPPFPEGLGPAAPLAALFEARLAYRAPEAPPQAPRPDYKFMQGDRRPKKKAKGKPKQKSK